MMSMLRAGGIEILSDGVRQPDVDNPHGYFELERVKSLATDSSWLESARGKAIKVISVLLEHLPRALGYKVLFMRRELDEVLESQARMLDHRGVVRRPPDPRLREEFAVHLAATERLLRGGSAFAVLDVSYQALTAAAAPEIDRVARFLGAELDRAAMIGCVDPSLHRCRRASGSEVPEAP